MKWTMKEIPEEDRDLTVLPETCTRQFVLTVGRNARFRSSLMEPDLFTVGIATRSTDQRGSSRVIRRKN